MIQRIKRITKGVLSGTGNIVTRAAKKPLKPRWLVMMTTDRCNSRCKHCNIWQEKPTENPLSPQELKKILSSPLFSGVEYVLNTGGEATTRGDLEEWFMVEHEVLPDAKLQLSTNGLLPDRALSLAKFAISKGICLEVGTSLDGMGDKHDFVRGVPGNFAKVERLLKELIELKAKNPGKLDVSVGFVLSDISLPLLPAVREYVKKEFNLPLNVQWYNESSFYDNKGSGLARNDEMYKTVKSLPPEMIGSHHLQHYWLRWLEGKSIKFSCYAMDTFCVMKCNGDVVPCLSQWDAVAGNMRENDPEEVWASAQAMKVRGIVKDCQGCLNQWGAGWSWHSSYFPFIFYYLGRPHKLLKTVA